MPDEFVGFGEPLHETEPDETRFTAFETWPWRQVLYAQEIDQSWIDLAESFYHAAEVIVDGVAEGMLLPDVHGVAAIFAFRHFLELILKDIVSSGRWLVEPHQNATREEFQRVAKEHNLRVLWRWVILDAKPKLEDRLWQSYDVAFVEACIDEFDEADAKSFAWRYPQQGCERYTYDFYILRLAMRHVRLVLNGIKVCLVETYAQNAEWEHEMRSMAD